jgi:hypothetical protein
MNTAALREQISRAHQHETSTGQLTRSWKPVAAPASGHLLPDVDAKGVMTRFVSAYIDEVPDLLDAANDVAREAGIEPDQAGAENRRAFLPAAARDSRWP